MQPFAAQQLDLKSQISNLKSFLYGPNIKRPAAKPQTYYFTNSLIH